jgi:hypothetical protein
MLTEQPILITSIKCTEPDGIFKNRFISFQGSYGTADRKSLGVVNADTNFGEMTPVTVKGIALVLTGGSIAAGDAVQTFDDGTVITQDAGPLEGYALDTASGASEIIRVLLS